jgi:ceramide glucosyltransferase
MGKVMLWSRAMMDSWGGTAALADEVCEDAAATKLVRRAGFKVRLVAAPFPQLLGHRTFRQVIDRQLRWATLRRKTFPLTFAAELASTAVIPALVMVTQGPLFALAAVASWYAAEMLLALAKGWHASWRMVPAMMVRDVMIPWIFAAAWFTSGFTWRGNKILVR